MKGRLYEDTEYEPFIARLKTSYGTRFNLESIIYNMFVVPIAFNKEHRTAVEKGEGTLDKEATSHDDVLDAFRTSLQYWVSN